MSYSWFENVIYWYKRHYWAIRHVGLYHRYCLWSLFCSDCIIFWLPESLTLVAVTLDSKEWCFSFTVFTFMKRLCTQPSLFVIFLSSKLSIFTFSVSTPVILSISSFLCFQKTNFRCLKNALHPCAPSSIKCQTAISHSWQLKPAAKGKFEMAFSLTMLHHFASNTAYFHPA